MTNATEILTAAHYALDGGDMPAAGRALYLARKSAAETTWNAEDLTWLTALDSMYHACIGSW